MESSEVIGPLTRKLAVLIATALAVNLLPFAMPPAHAAVGATAEVDVKTAYRGETATYTFTVNNTSTAGESIGSVALAANSTIWTVNSCATSGWPAGTIGVAGGYSYCLVNSGAAADIPAGGSRTFTVVARVSNTTADQTGAVWSVTVDQDSTYNGGANSVAATGTGAGLGTAVYVWRLTDAVVATSTTPVGSACPASNKSAPNGASRVITICGSLSGSTAEVPGSAAPASLGGTLLSGVGSYSASAASITPPATNRVIANWTGNTIGPPGGGKTVTARVRSNATETSPLVTFTGYQSSSVPTAVNDSVTVAEDSGATAVNVLTNDSDADGETISVVPSSGATSKGSFNCTAANCSYTPNPNANGSDSFGYTITDGIRTASATVDVTITAANDKPVADPQSVSVDEEQSTTVTLSGSDVESSSLTFHVGSLPNDGRLYVGSTTTTEITTGDYALPGDQVTYVPNADFDGSDSFTFTVSDGTIQSDPATVTVTVDPVNDAPVATDDSDSTDEDSPVDVSVLANDSDVDGDALAVQDATDPADGSVSCDSDSCTYTPDPNFNGSDSFSYTVSDGNGGTDTATVTVTVDPVNDAPVAADQAVSTDEDVPLLITLSASDGDDSAVGIDIRSLPATGLLYDGDTTSEEDLITATDLFVFGRYRLAGDQVTYVPNADQSAADGFIFSANDGTDDSELATVTVTVDPVNDAPVAADDEDSTSQDMSVTSALLTNDADLEGDTLIVTGASNGTAGTTTVNPDNTVTYTPGPGYTGTDSYTYDISDGQGGTHSAVVAITVNAPDDTTSPVADGGADASRISPNGDGKFDEMNVSADFSEESSWNLSIFSEESPSGPVYSTTGYGTHMEYTWDGDATDGSGLPDGRYRWELTGEDDAGNPMVGLDGSVDLDLTAPVLTGLKVTPRIVKLKLQRRTFKAKWPRRLVVRYGQSEAGTITATIVKKRRVIKKFSVATLSQAGSARRVWTGKDRRGRVVRPGKYRIVLRATDLAANTTVHRGLTIKVKPAPKRTRRR
jgi:Bacterial Ig domain